MKINKNQILFLVGLCLCIFLFLKISNLSIRLSDSNIYYVTGFQLLQGKILYKDIFFTNFPLLPYISGLYTGITFGSLKMFYLIPTLEVIATSIIIFLIVFYKTKKMLNAFIGFVLYLFSFIILVTSDHQTGVFIASLFTTIAYLFFEKKKFILSGIFLGFALGVKAYFIPVIIAFLLYCLFIYKWKKTFVLGFSLTITFLFLLIPSLILAPQDMFSNIFEYSLNRGGVTGKLNILWFFIKHDILFFMLYILSIACIKKYLFFGIISILSLIFIIMYQDVYYLYLNFLIPFLAIFAGLIYTQIEEKFKLQHMVIPTIIIVLLVINVYVYSTNYPQLQSVKNISQIAERIKKENPKYLYGNNEITPALSYLTKIPLLEGIIDTNINMFRSNIYNADKLTNKMLNTKTILITPGVYYPESGINEPIYTEIVNREIVAKNCTLIISEPVITESFINRINVFKCY